MADEETAVAVCYSLKIDGDDLGTFDSCDGLGCEVEMEQRVEGGNNGHVWQLPTRVRFSNVRLSRPVTAASRDVTRWFAGSVHGMRRRTATIEARTLQGELITSWGLRDVVPVRWTGPRFDSMTPEAAMETVELAHHGFFGPGWGG
ncbi:phage tail protein [Nonomuraea glycinis]|jgi:phage tail-like protein|uniref:Phage tail protein n=1 Tax=Nonomuraea glycinis TaxID=2047744 RepID=A0A918E9Q6_9ACTN|nr:phage tail protein [Nonomuraea glycinis]MCA2182750.1 phage tail protein [Nonomuraea glycinis]WSG71143.1 phage tail protein [Nonomuraea glycinis]GGP17262.1 phage tail protein [Nonomuraea glycinis]